MKHHITFLALGMLAAFPGCTSLTKGYKEESVIVKDAQGEWVVETTRNYKYREPKDRENDRFPDDKTLEQVANEPIDRTKHFIRPGPEDRH